MMPNCMSEPILDRKAFPKDFPKAFQERRMRGALLWTNLLNEPLFTLYGSLAFILYKDLGASAFTIALLTMLKPVITILSFYWSAGLGGGRLKLKSNVLWAGFWMRAPFLLCPWIDSVWYIVAAAVNYMFFFRAGIPGWLEMIKRSLGNGRERAFSLTSALGYGEGVILSLAMGGLLDRDPGLWKELFFVAALVGMASLFVQSRIHVEERVEERAVGEKGERPTLRELIARPWRDSFRLMRERPDFSRFQWGFMICGFGLMLFQPALPLFAVDHLGISYLEMAAAISIARGLGFVVSSPFWARWLKGDNVLRVSSAVFLAIGSFPIFLSVAGWGGLMWFYAAYFIYGVGQGGSHLVWNMSGPIFAGKEESSRYTGVNVVLAGLRGAVAPPLGGWLSVLCGPVQVLVLGSILCFCSSLRLLRNRDEKASTN